MIIDVLDIRWGGQSIITESCPFWEGDSRCRLVHIRCRYGLTNVRVPKECPLTAEQLDNISISLNVYETDPDEIGERRSHDPHTG